MSDIEKELLQGLIEKYGEGYLGKYIFLRHNPEDNDFTIWNSDDHSATISIPIDLIDKLIEVLQSLKVKVGDQ